MRVKIINDESRAAATIRKKTTAKVVVAQDGPTLVTERGMWVVVHKERTK